MCCIILYIHACVTYLLRTWSSSSSLLIGWCVVKRVSSSDIWAKNECLTHQSSIPTIHWPDGFRSEICGGILRLGSTEKIPNHHDNEQLLFVPLDSKGHIPNQTSTTCPPAKNRSHHWYPDAIKLPSIYQVVFGCPSRQHESKPNKLWWHGLEVIKKSHWFSKWLDLCFAFLLGKSPWSDTLNQQLESFLKFQVPFVHPARTSHPPKLYAFRNMGDYTHQAAKMVEQKKPFQKTE